MASGAFGKSGSGIDGVCLVHRCTGYAHSATHNGAVAGFDIAPGGYLVGITTAGLDPTIAVA